MANNEAEKKIAEYRRFQKMHKASPELAAFTYLNSWREEVRKDFEKILAAEMAKFNQNADEKFEKFLESGRGEKIVERVIGDIDIAGAIMKTGMALKGEKGDAGYTPKKGRDYFDGEPGYAPVKGKDYSDGKDADEGRVINAVLSKIKLPDENKIAEEAAKKVEEGLLGKIEKILAEKKFDAKDVPGLAAFIEQHAKKGYAGGGGAGILDASAQTFAVTPSTTTLTLNSHPIAGGRALWAHYNGQYLVRGTGFTVDGRKMTLLFTPENLPNIYVDVLYLHR